MKKQLFCGIIIVSLLCGCSVASAPNDIRRRISSQSRSSIKNGVTRTYKRTGDYQQDNGLTTSFDYVNEHRTAEERAQALSEVVTELEEIKSASVVITGNTAIVGIELAGELNNEHLTHCKREVEKRVKAEDNSIDHVSVTAATELVNRIHKMANPNDQSTPPPVDETLQNVIDELAPQP